MEPDAKERLSFSVKHYLSKSYIHILIFLIIGLIAYANTLHVPFYFDDKPHIIENPAIKYENLLFERPEVRARFIGYLSFALNYKMHGLNVMGYHIVNLAIHIINAILVYWFVILTFKTPPLTKGGTGGVANYIALFSSLLFVSHPIQTQAVTYIVQRFTSLATMFYLLSLVMYIKFRYQVLGNRQQDKTLSLKPKVWYLCSVISAILAMKTKEISFTLPVIIALYEFMFFSDNSQSAQPQAGPPGRKIRNPRLKRFLFLLPFLLVMIIIPMNFIDTGRPIGDAIGDVSDSLKVETNISRQDYLFTQFRVIMTYLRLLFLPINQNLDYDYPVYHSFSDPNVFLSFLFLLSVFCIGVYLLYKYRLKNTKEFIITPPSPSPSPARGEGSNKSPSSREEGVSIMYLSSKNEDTKRISPPLTGGDKGEGDVCGFANDRISNYSPFTIHYSLIAFGIFWFFITLSVESSVIPIRDVIFEHRMYLPATGLFISIITCLFLLSEYIVKLRKPIIISLAFLIVLLTGITHARNSVWGDEITFWSDVIKKSPKKARAYGALGTAYTRTGRLDEAIQELRKAISLKPDYPIAHNNLGSAYLEKGWLDEALKEFHIALALEPEYSFILSNIGTVYLKKGLIDKAIEYYQLALMLNAYDATAGYNIGIAYQLKGINIHQRKP